jgi:hypothetical protein
MSSSCSHAVEVASPPTPPQPDYESLHDALVWDTLTKAEKFEHVRVMNEQKDAEKMRCAEVAESRRLDRDELRAAYDELAKERAAKDAAWLVDQAKRKSDEAAFLAQCPRLVRRRF